MIGLMAMIAVFSGNQLYDICRDDNSQAVCFGYISGSADTMRVMADIDGKKYVCTPAGVTR